MAKPPATKGRRTGPMGGLTTADLIVLSLLAERPMHGYDLQRENDRQEVANWASVSKAQVYYALQKLVGMQLIAPVDDAKERAKAREPVNFAPTDAGRSALAAGLSDLAWARARVTQPFATWFGLSVDLPQTAIAGMLAARRDFLIAELARERDSLPFIAGLDSDRAVKGSLIVRLVIRQIEVEIDWIDGMTASGN